MRLYFNINYADIEYLFFLLLILSEPYSLLFLYIIVPLQVQSYILDLYWSCIGLVLDLLRSKYLLDTSNYLRKSLVLFILYSYFCDSLYSLIKNIEPWHEQKMEFLVVSQEK